MERLLEELLDGMEPEELDDVLPEEITADLSRAALARIERGALTRAHLQTVKHSRLRPWLRSIAVACLVIVIGAVGVFGVACAKEAEEYRQATEYFRENELSTDGMTRAQVKAAYRDIITKRRTEGQTTHGGESTVEGTQILTPEEPSGVWEWNSGEETSLAGKNYRVDYLEKKDEELDRNVLDKSFLECSENGEVLWTAEFTEFYVSDWYADADGVTVGGYDGMRLGGGGYPVTAWLARVDHNGTVLWKKPLEHGFYYESICDILDNEDGTLSVISEAEYSKCFCLSRYDLDGRELSFDRIETDGNWMMQQVAWLGDDYLLRLVERRSDGMDTRIVHINHEWSLIDDFAYESEEYQYYFRDMTVFGDRIYLSAYIVLKSNGSYELGNVQEYVKTILGEQDLDRDQFVDKLTSAVRENYTAVLLVCDPESGEPQTFYSVDGALADKLTVNGEQLFWETEHITSVDYLPTSSHCFDGTCLIYRYIFDRFGNLIDQENTGKLIPFWK